MKIRLLISDDREQIILHPESTHEESVLKMLQQERTLTIYKGEFFDCRAGYTRVLSEGYTDTILVLNKEGVKCEPILP
jgi:hypothetical protein